MKDHYTVDEILDPKFQSRLIAEGKAEADRYDLETGETQLDRDRAQLLLFIERRTMFTAYMVEMKTAEDRAICAEQVERYTKLIDSEIDRLGMGQ